MIRRWESFVLIEGNDGDISEQQLGIHFTRWTADLSVSFMPWTNALAAVAYWNSVWPDDKIIRFWTEIRRRDGRSIETA